MKIIVTACVVIFSLSLMSGCKGEKKEPKGPVADYYNGMLRSLDKAEHAQKQANLQALKAAITQYRIEREKNPESLEELKGQLGENFKFDDYIYNPETGEVTLKADLK